MAEQEKVFRYKLDFYYQSALIYLVTLIAYGGIRGNFVEAKFEYVLNDPLMYVILFFVLMSIVSLILNYIRNRRLVVLESAVIFRNRFRERRVDIRNIEWMHIGREAGVQTDGRFQVIVLKLAGRKRLVRVRAGRYERADELITEMNRIAERAPKRGASRWRRPGFTDR